VTSCSINHDLLVYQPFDVTQKLPLTLVMSIIQKNKAGGVKIAQFDSQFSERKMSNF